MMVLYDGQLQNACYNIREYLYKGKVKAGEKKKRKACEDIFTFDIEVSSFWIDENGNVIQYEKGKPAEYWNKLTPMALPYIWQFSMNNTVYYGRDFWDFYTLLDDLPKDCDIKIFVHNLGYEMHFLDNIGDWERVFCRVPHKPITCAFKAWPNIEFRCTYMLTRLSLASWGSQLGVKKMVGDLDYIKIRTPYTKLTQKELKYCEQDCRVVYAGIKQFLKTYKYINEIPTTQTGIIRRIIKTKVTADKSYMYKMHRLVPRNVAEYNRQQMIFAGGYTHANYHYAGDKITSDLYGLIHHLDFASSYPYVMLSERMPMSQFSYYGKKLPDWHTFDYKAYIMCLRFYNIESTSFNTYIQGGKCAGSGIKYDNGRILKAQMLDVWCTELDFVTIRNNYQWDDLEVMECWAAYKEYLPKIYTETILDLYHKKCILKGIPEKADEYASAKRDINSVFGMACTGLLQSDVTYDQHEATWGFKCLTAEQIQERLDDLKRWFDKRYFSHYAWGCWVTAAARRNLWSLIEKCDHDLLYCDTDSIFFIGDHDFTWYNDQTAVKLKKACDEMELDFEKTRPKDRKGIRRPLGILEPEEDCIEFKTLGAKKYVERWPDQSLHLTVAGINKGAVDCLENDIDTFADGFEFDKDHESVHKQIVTYITDQPQIVMPDGYQIRLRRGINLRANGYKIHLTDTYKQLIEGDSYDMDGIPDAVFNNLRSQILKREVLNNGW